MRARVFPLVGNQRGAVEPGDNVWLSASAGTGKTQVLSARVLRLLLSPDVDPSQILCLTFTKAGAAEMANRINEVLARWVRLDAGRLASELSALGAAIDPATQERARSLFASVLDCPGGGLRIDTIHAFSQWLLGKFPDEAGLPPGARPMEDRERVLLSREVMAHMLTEAETSEDRRLLAATNLFVTRKDPASLQAWLLRCASTPELWEGRQGWQSPMDARVRMLLGMPPSADEEWAKAALDPDIFPDGELRQILPLMQRWSAKTGAEISAFIEQWLVLGLDDRAEHICGFLKTVLKQDGEPRKLDKPSKEEPRLAQWQQAVADAVRLHHERLALLDLAELLTAALELGRAFAIRWQEAKQQEGLLDFDDLIRQAARLLGNTEASEWIRYKLDRRFDHILIDEAQDTNAQQWDIIFALIDDFFSGEGARGDTIRTIFTVGDYKQAIFGFQGTSPENFSRAREKVERAIADACANAATLRENRRLPSWQPFDLGQSFRTSQTVLEFVNNTIEALGHEAFGLPSPPEPHAGAARAGLVTLWQPVTVPARESDEREEDDERDWLADHDTALAERIARQVRRWTSLEEPFVLEKGKPPRHAGPGDIMILVRKRRELAAQIVAKLYENGVPVAGVDRLRLAAPLAVRDVMSALRFAALPLDDLECANLLTSPLVGWDQNDLLDLAPRPRGEALWHHLRDHADPRAARTFAQLGQLLARVDFDTPQALIAWILAGPWGGRAKLVARLGREANDPLDELLNAATAYETAHVPSLAGFIEWFDASTADLKRDPDDAAGQVRVLTVHGAKGLQAPIVILADATGEPGQGSDLVLGETAPGEAVPARSIPLPSLAKRERVGPISAAESAALKADMQEHWRLLYVAMTRAEEALFIGGAMSAKQAKKGVPEESWYKVLEPLFESDDCEDPIWGSRREWGYRAAPIANTSAGAPGSPPPILPRWALEPIGAEPRPPKPLAPSNAGEDLSAEPPLASAIESGVLAARRGVLIHRLLERLPEIASEERHQAAEQWLARQAGDLSPEARSDILESAQKVLDMPEFAALFGPSALAEVPLTARVGEIVVTGTLDRLLIEADRLWFIDFKTTRRPPARGEEVPRATLRQMAAYSAALEAIYPGREIRAGLLYTHAPSLIPLSEEVLARYKQDLSMAQESFGAPGADAY